VEELERATKNLYVTDYTVDSMYFLFFILIKWAEMWPKNNFMRI
jgi:hypothetical protein